MLKFDFNNLDFLKKTVNYSQTADAHRKLLDYSENSTYGFLELPGKDISDIKNYVSENCKEFDNLVVIGIGGSALGSLAVKSALQHKSDPRKKLIILDNVDPGFIRKNICGLDFKRTLVNVITKSGATAETMSIFLIILDIMKKKLGEDFKNHLVFTTDPEKGLLNKVANKIGVKCFEIPENVGGRFSVLTPAGLLPSAFLGLDIEKMLKGADDMKNICLTSDIQESPAYNLAISHVNGMFENKNIAVMFPYSNSLVSFADWFKQLWAESLGKRFDLAGKVVNTGQTPTVALGATDQHSQVQLYAEGPDDKIFTFLKVEKFHADYKIIKSDLLPELDYLSNHNLSDLLNAECLATEKALTDVKRVNCALIFPELDEYHLGQAFMLFEIMTVYAGILLNINPLDQPGVEAGKIATFSLMGRKGFEKEAEEMKAYLKAKRK
ncbi:MAG: glucose-6-phosphate isomerase [Candidatus Cloacimonadota bacterium]|nr:MAG: glucose-6-phosphate isomerase [Candidatus Cloacimonadota bacterium]